MPTAAPKPCCVPGCDRLAEPGTKSRCVQHPPEPRWGKRLSVRQRYGISDQAWHRLRARIRRRDHDTCYVCGQYGDQIDHIHPLAEGGARTDPDNLAVICRACHQTKSTQEVVRSNKRRAKR